MEKTKLLNAIGIAFSARKVIYGEKLLDNIKSNKVTLVILGIGMGPTAKKKLVDKCEFYQVPYLDSILTIDEIAHACGKKTMVAIGLNDHNFIKLIKSTL